MVYNWPSGSRAGSQIPTVPVTVTQRTSQPWGSQQRSQGAPTPQCSSTQATHRDRASAQSPTHVHTCSHTHIHRCTNVAQSRAPLTPKGLDLILAFLFSPAYPVTAQVTQTWAPRLWAGQAGTCPRGCMKTGGQRMQWAAWQRHRAVWLPVTCPPCLTSPTGWSLGQ